MFYAFNKSGLCVVVSSHELDSNNYFSIVESDVEYSPANIKLVDGAIREEPDIISTDSYEEDVLAIGIPQQTEDLLLSIVDLHERLIILEKEHNDGNSN